MSVTLTVTYKDKIVIQAEQDKTIKWLKEQLQIQTKIPIIQQELSYKNAQTKVVLSDNEIPIKFAQLPTTELTLKNLGKQIKWHHVFYVEYLGPIIILPLFYLLGNKEAYTSIQTVALIMSVIHYLKRQYQTAYIHVFSRESMPFKRVMINSFHYWILFALFNAIELYLFPSGHTYSQPVIAGIVGAWAFFEFMNFKCHTILGNFRKSPKSKNDKEYINLAKERQIPYGYGFDIVSCANYFWEALGWIAFSLLTRNYTAYLFTIFSIVQMAQWAKDKHRRYRKQFGDKYPKGRKAMFPFIF